MVWKRTTAHEARPAPLELRVLPDDLDDVVGIADLFDELL